MAKVVTMDSMKSVLLLLFVSFTFISNARAAAPVSVSTNSEGQAMMNEFLKQEAIRLDAKFLEGVTNREQWEARRPKLHQEYMEMLGLWPMPERTPLNAQVTGTIEREE